MDVELLQIVEVPKSERVLCRHEGCAHPVYKRIHVLRVDGELTFVGSECYKQHYQHLARGQAEQLPGGVTGAKLRRRRFDYWKRIPSNF